jgi:hypothetical protein
MIDGMGERPHRGSAQQERLYGNEVDGFPARPGASGDATRSDRAQSSGPTRRGRMRLSSGVCARDSDLQEITEGIGVTMMPDSQWGEVASFDLRCRSRCEPSA